MHQQHQPEKPRLLLVEDDESARISLSRVLSRVGYQIELAADGEQAIALLELSAQNEHFDVVLTDLLLHAIDGVQVLKHARKLPDPPEVVLLTGYGTLQTAIEALRAGAFDYLLKPCKPEDLLRCIGEAIRRRNERRTQLDPEPGAAISAAPAIEGQVEGEGAADGQGRGNGGPPPVAVD